MIPIDPRLKRCCLVFVLCASVAAGCAQTTASIVLSGLGKGTEPLDGAWKFHAGDDLAWASPTTDDSGWQAMDAGSPWEQQGHPGLTGFGWYRRHIEVSPGTAEGLGLSLYLPEVEDAGEVYWNGRLVGEYGKVPPHPAWYWNPLPKAIQLGEARSGLLAIRVWKSPHTFLSSPLEGGLDSIPQAGTSESVRNLETVGRYEWLRSHLYLLALVLAYGTVSVLSLFAWLRNPARKVSFWLMIAAATAMLLHLFDLPSLMSFQFVYGAIAPVIGLDDIAIWFLLIALLGLDASRDLVRWTKIMAVTAMICDLLHAGLQLFDWPGAQAHLLLGADAAVTIPEVLIECWGLVLVCAAFRKRLDTPRWLLAATALSSELYQAADDITGLGVRWTHWTIAQYLEKPLFSLVGNAVTAREAVNTLLLGAFLYAAWRYSVEQAQRQSDLEQEYLSAQEVQRLLIPEVPPATPGFAVETVYLPAREVGGDFYQVMPQPDGALLLIVGDVSGKGLKAAMTVSAIVGALRDYQQRQPAEVLAHLNRVLVGKVSGFATCCAALFGKDGAMTIANAGHLPPYCNGHELPVEGGVPLGLVADVEYAEVQFAIGLRDRVTFLSDGVLEATNPRNELFGFERMQAVSLHSAQKIAEAACAFGQEDDITVLTVCRTGAMRTELSPA